MLRVAQLTMEKLFVYLFSGGASYRCLMPGFLYGMWKKVETLLAHWSGNLGAFARVELQRLKHSSIIRHEND